MSSASRPSWRWVFAIGSFTLGILAASPGQAASFTAQVEGQSASARIEGLTLDSGPVLVELSRATSIPRGFIILSGKFVHSATALIVDGEEVHLDASGSFRHEIFLTEATQNIDVHAISLRGVVQSAQVEIGFPKYQAFRAYLQKIQTERKDFVVLSGGIALVNYQQTGLSPDLSERTALLQIGYIRDFTGSLTLNLAGSALIPVSSSTSGVSLSQFGLNARFGVALASKDKPWRINILGGVYYTTTQTSGLNFGYKNDWGPQLYPMLMRNFHSGDRIEFYAKYSPVAASINQLSFSDHEIATGLSYVLRLRSGNPFIAGFDFAQLHLNESGVSVNSRIFSLSAGYGI